MSKKPKPQKTKKTKPRAASKTTSPKKPASTSTKKEKRTGIMGRKAVRPMLLAAGDGGTVSAYILRPDSGKIAEAHADGINAALGSLVDQGYGFGSVRPHLTPNWCEKWFTENVKSKHPSMKIIGCGEVVSFPLPK